MADLPLHWAKADIVFKAIASIAIPVSLALVGHAFNAQQEQAAANLLKMERVEKMLSHLTSANDRERLLSMRVISFLAKQQQFPPELVEVMIGVARGDPAPDVSSSALETLATIAGNDTTSAPSMQAQQALKTLPRVLHIHIADETQREAALRAREQAKAQGYVVPSIVMVGPEYLPHQTQLRFFHTEDKDDAYKLVGALSGTAAVSLKDFTQERSAGRAFPRSLELWMAGPKKD